MAVVPLSGFPPEFRACCFKCGAHSVHFSQSRHSFMWGQSEWQFNCFVCGSVKYGEVAIRQVFDPQLKLWERKQAEEREAQERLAVLAREEAARAQRLLELALQREAERAAEEARLAREEVERMAVVADKGTPCAWEGCGNPASGASKYCSRTCSNNNARARYKARRATPPPTPMVSTHEGGEAVDAELRKAVLSRKAHYGTRTTTESA